MALKARTALRIVVIAAGLGLLAWNQFRPRGLAVSNEGTVAETAPATPGAAARPRTWKLGQLTLTACELGRPDSGLSAAAWCAPFEVPENRADPHSRRIRLNLAVIRSDAQVPARDMLVFLAGGPGQAATETWPMVAP